MKTTITCMIYFEPEQASRYHHPNYSIHSQVNPIGWTDVQGWAGLGGTKLGTTRTLPKKLGFKRLADKIKEHGIHGLLIVGGFEV